MGVTDIWRRDATNLGPNRGPGYDVVFLDPPYDVGETELSSTLSLLVPHLAAGATVVIERSNDPIVAAR